MTDVSSGGFPRRDDQGRVSRVGDLLGVSLAGLVLGLLALTVFDWAFALIGFGEFGRANGWLALLLPAWLFVDDFRAWQYGAARVVAALVAAGVGLAVGLLASGLAMGWPPLASGTVGAASCTVTYTLIWFFGVRWLAARAG